MSDGIVDIYNRALSAVSARRQISDPEEKGVTGDQCRLWYPPVRDTVLRSANWPSATEYSRLSLFEEVSSGEEWGEDNPSPGYKFAYDLPSAMLAPRWLYGHGQFELSWLKASTRLMTNVSEAILCYTARQNNPSDWGVGLKNSITYALAAAICIPLTGKRTLYQDLKFLADETLLRAQTDIANDNERYKEALPEWLSVRGYTS